MPILNYILNRAQYLNKIRSLLVSLRVGKALRGQDYADGKDHTPDQPHGMRHDAGLGAAKITILVNEIACKYSPHAVGTVGYF